MRVTQAIEDFFRGVRLIAGSLLAVGIVLLAGLLLVTGVLMAYTYDAPGYIWITLKLVAVLVAIPMILLYIGRQFRSSK
jgi:cytochrome b subunit of formate dehydrogenase